MSCKAAKGRCRTCWTGSSSFSSSISTICLGFENDFYSHFSFSLFYSFHLFFSIKCNLFLVNFFQVYLFFFNFFISIFFIYVFFKSKLNFSQFKLAYNLLYLSVSMTERRRVNLATALYKLNLFLFIFNLFI